MPWGAGILDKSIRANGFDGWEVDKTRKGVAPFSSFTEAQWSVETAKLAREHNNANVVSVGARMHSVDEVNAIVDAFIATDYSNAERHTRRINQLSEYEA